MIGVKGPVQERGDGAAGASPVHRGPEHKTVIVSRDIQKFIDRIRKDAAVHIYASVTGNAAGNRLVSDPEHICIDPVLIKGSGYFTERRISTSCPVGASVYQ